MIELRTRLNAVKPPAHRIQVAFLVRLIPWTLVCLLAILNIGSLLSESIHTAAFSALASIAGLAGQAVQDAVLNHSPTKAKFRAVDNATRQIQSERIAFATKNKALQAENEVIKASRAGLAREHETLRTTSAKRATAVRKLTTRTSAVLASRSAEALASLPVRAAPYVGIAALVAFTTYEIKTDCDLAKALAELNAEHGNDPVNIGQVCNTIEKVPTPQQAWNGVKAQAGAALKLSYDALEITANRLGLTINSQPLK